jgi:hypothetical protein
MQTPRRKPLMILLNCGKLGRLSYMMRRRGPDGLSVDLVRVVVRVGSGGGQPISEDEKDLEILLLRQQLGMVERKQLRGPHIPRAPTPGD